MTDHSDGVIPMPDQWSDRLSEYLDGELSNDERTALDAHLEACAECRTTLTELRSVSARAVALPDRMPATDGWAMLRASIEAKGAAPLRLVEQGSKVRRTFAFSMPQAAAAALLLAVAWGGSIWMARRGVSRGIVASSAPVAPRTSAPRDSAPTAVPNETQVAEVPRASRLTPHAAVTTPQTAAPERVARSATPAISVRNDAGVRFETREYGKAVADLERVLHDGRGQLDTATVRALEESLRSVDHALRQARAALERDPSNSYLNDHLARTMKRKIELLRDAATIVGTQT